MLVREHFALVWWRRRLPSIFRSISGVLYGSAETYLTQSSCSSFMRRSFAMTSLACALSRIGLMISIFDDSRFVRYSSLA